MKPQLKPNRWSCSVTAFAMAMDIPVKHLIQRIGHDGGEIIWPDLPEPTCRRGFHVQELIEQCHFDGLTCTPIELMPSIAPMDGHAEYNVLPVREALHRFELAMCSSQGVLECRGERSWHAMAYEDGVMFNPDDGRVYDFYIRTLHAMGLRPYRIWMIK